MKWRLTGTPSQQAIILDAFDKIKFPWDRLNITWRPELGWRDLNSGYFIQSERPLHSGSHNHDHYSPENEGPPEPLNGELEGRRFTMGVFYPGSGRIYIDHRLERYPAMAQATLSAEVAHAVDEFLPLTEAQRNAIIECIAGPNSGITWWERNNYSTEYWSLAGEMFMPIFTDTFSDIPFGSVSSFTRNPRECDPNELTAIMGIKRTDFVPPTPPAPPPPPEPVIEPEAEVYPIPAPVPTPSPEPAPAPAPVPAPAAPEPHSHTYMAYGKSKVLHKPDHYENKKNGRELHQVPTGFRFCKVCKPH